MSRDDSLVLSDQQIFEAKRLASEARRLFGVYPNVPIGSDIRLLLEKNDVLLCEYPYPDSQGTHTYGNITWIKNGDEIITFIGLNTSSYYDEQIFAIAHEIYHYTTKTGKAYTPDVEYEDQITEKMADRFAVELLLPAEVLFSLVTDVFGKVNMYDVPENKTLRFIARIQCDWWLPYQAIINRLFEEKLISVEQYNNLYDLDCRSENGVYRRILKSTDGEISELLNKKTKSIGVSNKVIETIISNYEDGLIDENEFIENLALFGKKPDDFGFDMNVEFDDDLKDLFESEEN